jgi:hypothetical protein
VKTTKNETIPTMDNHKHKSVEHAHERLDILEPKVKTHSEWIVGKDKNLEKIKNWLIGGVVIGLINAFGLAEIIKSWVLLVTNRIKKIYPL